MTLRAVLLVALLLGCAKQNPVDIPISTGEYERGNDFVIRQISQKSYDLVEERMFIGGEFWNRGDLPLYFEITGKLYLTWLDKSRDSCFSSQFGYLGIIGASSDGGWMLIEKYNYLPAKNEVYPLSCVWVKGFSQWLVEIPTFQYDPRYQAPFWRVHIATYKKGQLVKEIVIEGNGNENGRSFVVSIHRLQ